MSLTVGQIAKRAFDAVAKKLNGVIFDAVLTTDEKGAYNTTTASYDDASDATSNCRVIVDKTPRDGKLGTYTIGEKEKVILVEGLKTAPAENMTITFNGDTKTITFIDDILFAGELYYMVVR